MVHLIVLALAFHGVDLVSGFVAAVMRHNVASSKLRDGLFKKLGFLLCYVLCALLDRCGADIGLSLSFDLLPAAVGFGVLAECSSILENCVALCPGLSKLKIFRFLQDVNEEEEEQ